MMMVKKNLGKLMFSLQESCYSLQATTVMLPDDFIWNLLEKTLMSAFKVIFIFKKSIN